MTSHVNRARWSLTDVRWHLRMARDAGEVTRDTARLLLAQADELDVALSRHEDGEA